MHRINTMLATDSSLGDAGGGANASIAAPKSGAKVIPIELGGQIITLDLIRFAQEKPLRVPRKTVFDIDDVAWGLSERVATKVGVDFQNLVEFHILENERLTMDQRLAVNDCFRNPEIFRDIQFYPGFEQVMDLTKIGATVQMNSNSFSEEVRASKIVQVLTAAPGAWYDHLRFNVVNEATTLKKRFDDDTYILVDDSPYNIALSPAVWNIVPRKPWNLTPRAMEIMKGKTVIYVQPGDFGAIIRLVASLLYPDFPSLKMS